MTDWRKPEQPDLPGQKTASNSRKGKQFEAEIEAVNNYYRKNGIVDVVRNAEKWTAQSRLAPGQTAESFFRNNATVKTSRSSFIARAGETTAQKQYVADNIAVTANGWILRREDSDVDFSGGNDECAYAFDTKECAADYISMEMLKPHQIERLKLSRKCRTIAGFLIKFTAHNRVFFAPIVFVLEKQQILSEQDRSLRAKPGTASISIAELETSGKEIFQDRRNGLWDWFRYIAIRNGY